MTTAELSIESCALHTEEPRWAIHAPEQVTAALKRGAHVIGFTEVHGEVAKQIQHLCDQHGYKFLHGKGDTAVAYKAALAVTKTDPWHPTSGTRGYTSVEFTLGGITVTVFEQHWGTNKPAHHDSRVEQTRVLIADMKKAAEKGVVFYLGDCNPAGKLSDPHSFPRKDFDAAGMPLVYEDLDVWPAGIGVNAVGCVKDSRVDAVSVKVYDSLGSDHRPVLAVYDITVGEEAPHMQSRGKLIDEALHDLKRARRRAHRADDVARVDHINVAVAAVEAIPFINQNGAPA